MRRVPNFSILVAFASLLTSAPALAGQCCTSPRTTSCKFSDHEDARCSTGTQSSVFLNDVWGCPQSNEIVLDGDPLTFLISYAIATANAGAYCEQQSGGCGNSLSSLCGDTDGDGLWDIWEEQGLDGDGDGTPETYLPGAASGRKDVFVEVDCMKSDGNADGDYNDTIDHSHCPKKDALELAVRSYANAPVVNPDGTSGIQLHIDVGGLFGAGVVVQVAGTGGAVGTFGDLGGGGDVIDEAGNAVISLANVPTLKSNYFDSKRRRAFRYAIFAHTIASDCTSGVAETPGNDLIISLGGLKPTTMPSVTPKACWGTDANGFSVGSAKEQAGTFMHELGHTLGRRHGGLQVSNRKPNYLSVMRYGFQMCSVPAAPSGAALAPGACDYSAIELPALDETSLNECAGIDGGLLGFGPTDWNKDKVLQGASCAAPNNVNVARDINDESLCVGNGPNGRLESTAGGDDNAVTDAFAAGANGVCETTPSGDDTSEVPLLSYEDWNQLQLALATDAEFADGVTPTEVEATPEMIEADRLFISEQSHPDLSIETSAPATVLPGEGIEYRVQLSSHGRGPALKVRATLLGPDGRDTTAAFPALVLGQSEQLAATFSVPADACPTQLIHTTVAEYEDLAGFLASSSSVALSTVLDIVPPNLSLIGSSAVVLECGVDAYSEAGAIATDSCDPNVPVSVGGDTVQVGRPGAYTVIYSASDDSGNFASIRRNVRVQDTIAPSLSVTLSPSSLRPPNHKLVEIVPTVAVRDACDPSPVVSLVGISSSEPANGTGDGNTPGDIVVDPQGKIFLRAERSGNGAGRVYKLTFKATDASGNARTFDTNVTVPKG
ncbi:MAG TPA: immunoglobulin-like domain-containing protein [Polyangiaceae bacterium]|nr:immunoglobulin-like domain-containing protein [Polyangiaceae bacterium]